MGDQRDCIMKFFNALARYSSVKSHGITNQNKLMPTASKLGGFDKWMAELLRRVGVEDFKIMREQMYRYHALHKTADVQRPRRCVKALSSWLLNMRYGMDKYWLKSKFPSLSDQEHRQFVAKYWPRKIMMSDEDLDALDR